MSNRRKAIATEAPEPEERRDRLRRLGLYGLLARWDELRDQPWIDTLLAYEESERQRRSLERRTRYARVGRFKPVTDFDWQWPKRFDADAVRDLFRLDFLTEAANVILFGQNGLGKTMLAQNLAHQALLGGYSVRFTSASEMLNELAAQDGAMALERRLRRYCRPALLVIDELGYLSYDDRHADLLFEVVARRHGEKSIVVTTNKPFKEWNEVFPNASSVVALVDRLAHNAEILTIEGDSYRLKESKERTEARKQRRAGRK